MVVCVCVYKYTFICMYVYKYISLFFSMKLQSLPPILRYQIYQIQCKCLTGMFYCPTYMPNTYTGVPTTSVSSSIHNKNGSLLAT